MNNKNSCGLFIEYNNKILILHRNNINYQDYNKWGLVGGEINDNELPEVAISRKAKEEIGLDISNYELEILGKEVIKYPNQIWNFYVYRIKIPQEIEIILNKKGHSEFKYLKPIDCYTRKDLMSGLYKLLEKFYLN